MKKKFFEKRAYISVLLAGSAIVLSSLAIAGAPGTIVTPTPTASASASASPSASPSTSPSASPSVTPSGNVITTLQAQGNYTQALLALNLAGLTSTFEGAGPFTLLAPNDAAFAKIPAATAAQYEANPTLLKQILNYHAIQGEDSSSQLLAAGTETSIEGEALTFAPNPTNSSQVQINGTSNIVQPDLQATNGVIQGVDTVLVPPSLASPSPSPSASASSSPSPSPSVSASPSASPSP
jgi:uncharacterized surface protein with fasciclin (FAS1) repeats